MFEQSTPTHRPVEIVGFNRPIRAAFIVPIDNTELSHWILDAIFADSYSRWGGSRSLIIPHAGEGGISPEFQSWLRLFDPDYVFAYVTLNDVEFSQVDRLASPIELIEQNIENIDRWYGVLPSWPAGVQPIPATSTLFSMYADYPGFFNRRSERLYVTQYPEIDQARFLPDNFAVRQAPHRPMSGDRDGNFSTLCYTPESVPERVIVGDQRDPSLGSILSRMARRECRAFAKHSAINSKGIFRPHDFKWARSFHIVIGSHPSDRINFWNVRHFSHGREVNEVAPSIILSPEQLQDGAFVTGLVEYLNAHNYRGDGGQGQINILSKTVDKVRCEQLARAIQEHARLHCRLIVEDDFDAWAMPNGREYERSMFREIDEESHWKVNETSNEIALEPPSHTRDLPASMRWAAIGDWAIDVKVERHQDDSRVVNLKNYWRLPRRTSATQAFTSNLAKINLSGGLSIIPSQPDNNFQRNRAGGRLKLNLPDDLTVFRQMTVAPAVPRGHDRRDALRGQRYDHLSISDKGQNFLGVVSKFDLVEEAAEVLTNKYWRRLLRDEVTSPDSDFSVNQLRGFLHAWLGEEGTDAELKLMKDLHFSGEKELRRYLIASLEDTLECLVSRGVFQQVHSWRCGYCGNQNSRSLDTLKRVNRCDVCEKSYSPGIDIEFRYRPLRFMVDTLITRNGLPVLWVAAFLRQRSFSVGNFFLPEVNLRKEGEDREEIDLLAVVDGDLIAVEVKKSATAFLNGDDSEQRFIRKIARIRPDQAILAFEMALPPGSELELEDVNQQVRSALERISNAVGGEISVSAIFASQDADYRDFPRELGFWGKRMAKLIA